MISICMGVKILTLSQLETSRSPTRSSGSRTRATPTRVRGPPWSECESWMGAPANSYITKRHLRKVTWWRKSSRPSGALYPSGRKREWVNLTARAISLSELVTVNIHRTFYIYQKYRGPCTYATMFVWAVYAFFGTFTKEDESASTTVQLLAAPQLKTL